MKGPIPIDQIKTPGRGFFRPLAVFDQNGTMVGLDKNDQEIPSKLLEHVEEVLYFTSKADIRSRSISTRFKFIFDSAVDLN